MILLEEVLKVIRREKLIENVVKTGDILYQVRSMSVCHKFDLASHSLSQIRNKTFLKKNLPFKTVDKICISKSCL